MELDYGQGRIIACTLDLEDQASLDPSARRLAGRLVEYALHSELSPRTAKVVYLGGAAGAAWLDQIGVGYERSTTLDSDAGLVLVGPDAAPDAAALAAWLAKGGRAFFLPRAQSEGWLGTTLKPAATDFAGSLSVPAWPETRGLSASDLRWRSHLDTPAWVLGSGVETAAEGLIGRQTVGKGVAIFCQVDPDRFHADEKTYLRYTRWRATRAVAQLLANLGASFPVDRGIFHPLRPGDPGWETERDLPGHQSTGWQARSQKAPPTNPQGNPLPGYYSPDYRADFPLGDNPYRYYRW
jgi:beta-galactosidase